MNEETEWFKMEIFLYPLLYASTLKIPSILNVNWKKMLLMTSILLVRKYAVLDHGLASIIQSCLKRFQDAPAYVSYTPLVFRLRNAHVKFTCQSRALPILPCASRY
jgi:hypothetical protein